MNVRTVLIPVMKMRRAAIMMEAMIVNVLRGSMGMENHAVTYWIGINIRSEE